MNVLQRIKVDVSTFVRIYRLVIAVIVGMDLNLQMIKEAVKVQLFCIYCLIILSHSFKFDCIIFSK
jgi:hypothetical protein